MCVFGSPSSRGRGLKFNFKRFACSSDTVALFTRAWIEMTEILLICLWSRVALFTRAWIEINFIVLKRYQNGVALFTRAWIEINIGANSYYKCAVALFTRAWIEIASTICNILAAERRPLHEGVD